jgi:glycosyltransferase involved in cell wall biosynthesis
MANHRIEFLGYKPWNEIKEIVGKARFLALPSEWYENNPLSVIESLCLGTPVLGAHIGGIPELIQEGKNGALFESRNINDLKEKIHRMAEMHFDYEAIAQEAQYTFSETRYYQTLANLYSQQ